VSFSHFYDEGGVLKIFNYFVALVTECWDPLSTTQTLRLVGFINRLGREFPLSGTNKQLNKLFESIMERMRLALENDVFIPIFPKQ